MVMRSGLGLRMVVPLFIIMFMVMLVVVFGVMRSVRGVDWHRGFPN